MSREGRLSTFRENMRKLWRKGFLWSIFFIGLTLQANAQDLEACFLHAGAYYGVSPLILKAIAEVESGMNPKAINHNRNGTKDLGIMQINTIWLKELKKYGIGEKELLEDPCLNIHIGAWILNRCIAKYGYNWKAVGCYHSCTPKLNENYSRRIYAVLNKWKNRYKKTNY